MTPTLAATIAQSGLFPPTLSALLAEIQERFHQAHRCQGCGVDEGMQHIEVCPLWRKANGLEAKPSGVSILNLKEGDTVRANELIAACRAVGIKVLGDAVADDGMESDARLTAARAESARLREALTKIATQVQLGTFAHYTIKEALAPQAGADA